MKILKSTKRSHHRIRAGKHPVFLLFVTAWVHQGCDTSQNLKRWRSSYTDRILDQVQTLNIDMTFITKRRAPGYSCPIYSNKCHTQAEDSTNRESTLKLSEEINLSSPGVTSSA
ncbi:hypothetical protein EJ08DRAFT_362804 [Tothia fuscella]|uniref:Uncharacterized protein n=1 Tax=Tothia fuscella TaxID=1048955 RepID=A0A9P4NM00_9PEZI|nr:hypothetical protein EJ08DRAFT_362804 [Tothia fuscella]